jgi:peptidoglycan/LPS O-acetylase OafA/YrhL
VAPASASSQHVRLGYMPALDGVRAMAVVAVLLNHADVSWAGGGYLGVDAFFVLSGFLITREGADLVAGWLAPQVVRLARAPVPTANASVGVPAG